MKAADTQGDLVMHLCRQMGFGLRNRGPGGAMDPVPPPASLTHTCNACEGYLYNLLQLCIVLTLLPNKHMFSRENTSQREAHIPPARRSPRCAAHVPPAPRDLVPWYAMCELDALSHVHTPVMLPTHHAKLTSRRHMHQCGAH